MINEEQNHAASFIKGKKTCNLIRFSLLCTEDTLWTGIPGDYTNPDAPKALAEVRKLVDDGQYVEATEAGSKLVGKPNEVSSLMALDLFFLYAIFKRDNFK